MAENKLDITSTAVEKGIDLVKGFIEKLIGSTLEETGNILFDNVRLYRLKNQIKIMSKVQKIVEDNNIEMKQISLKTLVPLLDYSSLEDNETLQDKWTNLIVNYVDSKEKYESTIFPFILNQLTSTELKELDLLYDFEYRRAGSIKTSGIYISNLTRLGLIEQDTFSSIKLYPRGYGIANDIKYNITELGKEFVRCCSPRNK